METKIENYKFLSDNIVQLEIDASCYTREAVTSTTYTLAPNYMVSINTNSKGNWIVLIDSSQDNPQADLLFMVKKFRRDLVDFQVRDDIERRTGKFRELIVEHAFAPIREEND